MKNKMITNLDYDIIKEEFNTYKSFSEKTIDILKDKVSVLEKKIDSITNVMEVSKCINLNVSENDLIQKINDMIMGVMGVEYGTIYIKKKDKLIVEATNIDNENLTAYTEKYYRVLDQKHSFILNCKSHNAAEGSEIKYHSIIGVPILLKEKLLGYIVLEHSRWQYFGEDHLKFLKTISNHIGIAMDNNFLYMKIKENAIKDPLLGIYNRKFFFDRLDEKIKADKNQEFAIVMMDIDDFKKLNDSYGHQFGDDVLHNISDLVKSCLDEEDILARYGGEELIVYINDCQCRESVIRKVEEFRARIKTNSLIFEGKEVKTTVSFGIGFYPEDHHNIDKVVSVADKNLYVSKSTGKDRVTACVCK